MINENKTQTEKAEMKKIKLSKAQAELLEELKIAPLYSSRKHFSWYETYIVDAPYYDKSAIGWIHCHANKSTLECLQKKGVIEILVLGDSKINGVQTDLVKLIGDKQNAQKSQL